MCFFLEGGGGWVVGGVPSRAWPLMFRVPKKGTGILTAYDIGARVKALK